MLGVVLGLVLVLLVSGLVEGYVTGSALPWAAKIAIGLTVLAGFWTLVLTLGRRAARMGETGDVSGELREDTAPVSA